LDDGVCVPILLLLLALATGKVDEGGHWQLAMKLVVEEIGIGLAVGLLLVVRVSSLSESSSSWLSLPHRNRSQTKLPPYIGGWIVFCSSK
jgi:NhaP-type Na+/H+ or K+/H+ antiporter